MKYNNRTFASWNDGVTAYMVDKKEKEVGIYKATSDKKDKYLSKFKFNLNDFIYSWSPAKEGYRVSMKLKTSKFWASVRWKDSSTAIHTIPLSVRIKVAFFWTTVKYPTSEAEYQ